MHTLISGGSVSLYDVQGGDRHEKEANEAEKDAITKAKAMDAELDEAKLQIDTGKAKKSNTRTPVVQNLLHHPAGAVFMQDMNNRAARLNHRQVHLHDMQERIAQLEAMRPEREVADILAEVRAMNGAFNMDNIPAPEVRMQQMQQLQDLQRRAQANLAQRPLPQNDPPAPNPRRPARRGREAARPPGADQIMAAARRNQLPNQGPDPFFQLPVFPDYNPQVGWAGLDGGGFADAPQGLEYDPWAGPQPPMPRLARPFQVDAAGGFENPQMAQQRAAIAQAAAQRQAARAQRDAAHAQAAAQRQAARAQRDAAHAQRQAGQAGQIIQATFAQVQEQLAAAGININFNGGPLPMVQFNEFPPNNNMAMGRGRQYR